MSAGRVAAIAVAALACACSKSEIRTLATEPLTVTVTGFAADADGVAWIAAGHDANQLKTRDGNNEVLVVASGYLFAVALDHDAVYWSDGEHIWRAARGGTDAKRLADTDDTAHVVIVSAGYVYWATKHGVARVPVGGGATEVVAASPVPDALVDRIAISDSKIVASISVRTETSFRTELWRLDGAPRKIGALEGLDPELAIDGDHVWTGVSTATEWAVDSFPLDGGAAGKHLAGQLVTAGGGVVYIDHETATPKDYATFAVDASGAERRVGPNAAAGHAVVIGDRLFAAFAGPGQDGVTTLGSVSIR